MNVPRILAVDPGRRALGVAVFEGAELRYYAVRTLRVPGTPADVRRAAARVLGSLVAMYQPTHLAIKQPLVVHQRAELLAHVIGALKAGARRRGLAVSEYAPLTVRRFICGGASSVKREVSSRLAVIYPEISRYLTRRGIWAELYYERMFGAVAVGLMAHAQPSWPHGAPSSKT